MKSSRGRCSLQIPLLLLLAGFCLLGSATSAVAQTTGSLKGVVRDQEGAPLPGVLVTATSETRGVARSAVTSPTGSYAMTSLLVDNYTVKAVLEGFQEQTVEGVRVGLGSAVSLDLVMPLATVEEVITVAGAPILDVTSSSVDTSFTAEFIEDLPTTRNFYDMMAVAPGISQGSEGSTALSAYGSSIASNSWNIDGQNTTNADTGNAWWYINPQTIEEIQVLAVGAPAEYGNMSGAALNVVTKSGTNDLAGSFSAYLQADSATSTNADINGIEYERDEFRDLSFTLGGPIVRDKLWFFGAYQESRDSFSEPGVDPNFPTSFPSDRYDVKFNAQFSDNTSLDAKYHYENYDWVFADPFLTPDATGVETGKNPAWGAGLQHLFGSSTLFEARYAGYSGDDDWVSSTGSFADPFIDYSPPGGGPAVQSEGIWYPYRWDLANDQADVKLSTHAADFLGGDHEFKFGITFSRGEGDTIVAGGENGVYFYRYEYSYEYYGYTYTTPYYYRVTARPYHYGAETETISAFVQDSWQIGDRLTLNVGVRYDDVSSDIPDFPRLNQDWTETGDIIPGLRNAVEWSNVSPRLGFAYQVGDAGVLRGFYGKFFDGNVTGNWYAPPPDAPSYLYEFSANRDGPWTPFFLFEQLGTTVDPDLDPPETDQYTLGYEQRIGRNMTLGLQLIHKETENLIGWEILGDGVYELVPWTNPITGEVVNLRSIIEQPSTRKGNRPGAGSAAPDEVYNQEFDGATLSFNKRYSAGWSMQASYTWSDSEGFIPRPLSQSQGAPFYAGGEGRDPNNWINANQALQNQREHVFQAQANFDLPWSLNANVIYRYLDGRPFNRQVQVGAASSASPLNQGIQTVIAVPASNDSTLPSQNVLDLGVGRRFVTGPVNLKVDVQVLNLFNEDSNDFWQTLVVNPGSNYVASDFITPRRLMLRLGVEF